MNRTWAKHTTVYALLIAGHTRRSIQRPLGMTYRTVQRLADGARPEDLFQEAVAEPLDQLLSEAHAGGDTKRGVCDVQ